MNKTRVEKRKNIKSNDFLEEGDLVSPSLSPPRRTKPTVVA
jgi:hypothetical protein